MYKYDEMKIYRIEEKEREKKENEHEVFSFSFYFLFIFTTNEKNKLKIHSKNIYNVKNLYRNTCAFFRNFF